MAGRTQNLSSMQADDLLSRQLAKVAARNAGKTSLPEHEVKELLKKSGLAVPKGLFVPKGEALRPRGLHYPLIAKVSSSFIASKSDVGGVVPDINDRKSLAKTVTRLMEIELAEGVLIEEMAPPGVEVIIGGIIDMQFGPVVMFGLGGIFVELFKDVAFGLAPMNEEEALKLVRQVKGYRLLEGYRGRPAMDIDGLLKTMVAVSSLIDEMDLNPVALYPDRAIILDAKLSLRKSPRS